MKRRMQTLFVLLQFISICCISTYGQINPREKFGVLFQEVQRKQLFIDQKSFADVEPRIAPDSILYLYNLQKNEPDFNLKSFVDNYFIISQKDTVAMLRHIDELWSELTRAADVQHPYSSLLALPKPYIVPGGRFKEIYYWDSYFTMLGLEESGEIEMVQNMVDNFAYLIETYGLIPNGNRTYYLSRSQPPFFSLMVGLLAKMKNDKTQLADYAGVLEKEYLYWMNENKSIHLDKQLVLNRYYDELNTPRPESYLQDEELFLSSKRDSTLFRDIRSAAESGWDFSTRWFEDGKSLSTIITTQLIPVDLNSLLYHLELTLAETYLLKNNLKKSAHFKQLALKRKEAIIRYCWNEGKGFFCDYNFKTGKQSSQMTLAGLYPLFFEIASPVQAAKVKSVIEKDFLIDGGLVTTLTESEQQWDSPNGWAPLHWIAYRALTNYGYDLLAQTIASRWTALNMKVYFETGKMMEKYNVLDTNKPGGGGEYDAQDGFGWTNGVFLKFHSELEKHKKQH